MPDQILDTATKMYEYFLYEVRKERNTTIEPWEFNQIINAVQINWIKSKLPTIEFNQKRIDDLEAIKVMTDGIQFSAIGNTEANSFPIPYEDDQLPVYMHGISVAFTKEAQDNGSVNEDADERSSTIKPTGDVYFGKPLRADSRWVNKQNPYRQEDGTFVYFEQRGGNIIIDSKESFTVMILEYYKYPDLITVEDDSTEESNGSFRSSQNKEIVDMAVTTYLERVTDPRIKSQPGLEASIPK